MLILLLFHFNKQLKQLTNFAATTGDQWVVVCSNLCKIHSFTIEALKCFSAQWIFLLVAWKLLCLIILFFFNFLFYCKDTTIKIKKAKERKAAQNWNGIIFIPRRTTVVGGVICVGCCRACFIAVCRGYQSISHARCPFCFYFVFIFICVFW